MSVFMVDIFHVPIFEMEGNTPPPLISIHSYLFTPFPITGISRCSITVTGYCISHMHTAILLNAINDKKIIWSNFIIAWVRKTFFYNIYFMQSQLSEKIISDDTSQVYLGIKSE